MCGAPMTVISIHAPREGSDRSCSTPCTGAETFQSTLPVRGATLASLVLYGMISYFNPRSP